MHQRFHHHVTNQAIAATRAVWCAAGQVVQPLPAGCVRPHQ
jgi:hypothetical protein